MAAFPGSEGGLVERLVNDCAEAIRVLVTRDGVALTEEQILERARNIVTIILGNYDVRPLPGPVTIDFAENGGNNGRPYWHGWSCKCPRCVPPERKTP